MSDNKVPKHVYEKMLEQYKKNISEGLCSGLCYVASILFWCNTILEDEYEGFINQLVIDNPKQDIRFMIWEKHDTESRIKYLEQKIESYG